MYDAKRTRAWAHNVNGLIRSFGCRVDDAPPSVSKPYRAMLECSEAFCKAADSSVDDPEVRE